MSMIKSQTAKSTIYEFDGYSDGYGAFVQGAFVGKFIVPQGNAKLVQEGDELNCLTEMHAERRFGVVLKGARTIV